MFFQTPLTLGSYSLETKEKEGRREEKWRMVFRILGLKQKEQEGGGTTRSGLHIFAIYFYLSVVSPKVYITLVFTAQPLTKREARN